jgi:hypothetical protein
MPGESIEDDLRKGIGCPSMDFGNEANWETWIDILPESRAREPRLAPGFAQRGGKLASRWVSCIRSRTDTSEILVNPL